MGALVIKYVQLICVAFFMKNSNCSNLTEAEEINNLNLGVCVAECFRNTHNPDLESCVYGECSDTIKTLTSSASKLEYLTPDNSTSFYLYCRDAHKIMIQIEHDDVDEGDNETYIYMLMVQESTGKFMDRLVYFSDQKLVTVDDLSTNESTTSLSYNISAYIVSSKHTIQKLGTKKYTTLMENYMPESIMTSHITTSWEEAYDEDDKVPNLSLLVKWKPSADHTCGNEIVMYSDEYSDFIQIIIEESKLYEHTFSNLKHDSEYSIGVNTFNTHKPERHSITSWKQVTSPSCETCHFIRNITVHYTHKWSNLFNINITWLDDRSNIAYYLVEVADEYANLYTTTKYYKNVTFTEGFAYYENFEVLSGKILINVSSYSVDHENLANDYTICMVERDEPSLLMTYLFYAAVIFSILIILIIFKIWKNKINSFLSSFAQKRLNDMDIEVVKRMSKGTTVLDSITELGKDTTMEVDKGNITILELLGEGAFGFVKKGLMIKNGEKEHVAVKMLKNTSNIEDIKQFHQEITVMKSVGQHENIVSIVGHSTSDINYLMLLTEYCDAGSLIDILRLEFAKQLKFYDKKGKLTVQITSDKYPDSLLNFDMSESDKKEISYKNIGCPATHHHLFVVNQMYDELNNNTNNGQMLKVIEMTTATNALYLKLKDNETVIEIPKENDNPTDFLTSSDLLLFARQICDGMDFLARKKVVHRDLAARNILVCSNKTVKISDFGLSRDIYQDNVYRKTGNGKLPIKWLALESLTHQVYTSKSDVWSFGILLYEIVTLGAVPYSSISVENLLKVLKTGYRMERPIHCHILLYEMMMLCWHINPLDRPSFGELSERLENFLNTESTWGERIIDLDKMFDKCMNEMNYMKPLI